MDNSYQKFSSLLYLISSINSRVGVITLREKEAYGKIKNVGDLDEALEILYTADHSNELKQAEASKENKLEKLSDFIHEDRFILLLLELKGEDTESLPILFRYYNEAVKVAEKYLVGTKVVYEYAEFLCKHKLYETALEKLRWLCSHYALRTNKEFEDELEKGKCYGLMATVLHTTKQFTEAGNFYRKSIEIWKELVKEAEKKHEIVEWEYFVYLATCYAGFGNLLTKTKRYSEAEELYRKAIKIWDTEGVYIPIHFPNAREIKMADVFMSLANLLSKVNRFDDEAVQLCKRAIKIWKELVRSNHGAYTDQLAKCYFQFSVLYDANKQPAEARKNCRKAIAIWEKLAKDNPNSYEIELAKAYMYLGELLLAVRQFKRADVVLKKAEEIAKKVKQTYKNNSTKKP